MLVDNQSGLYLGPARVTEVCQNQVQLTFPDQVVWADLAMGFSYSAVENDIVLAISQGEQWYVIGVIQGQGKTTFSSAGDIQFLAPNGSIRFASNEIRLTSRSIAIAAKSLRILSERVSERFQTVSRFVKKLANVHVGELRTRIDSTCRTQAKKIVQQAEHEVKIDGKKIHLG